MQIDRGEALVAAEVPCQYGAVYESVMCRGKATKVDDSKEKCEALSLLMKTQIGKAQTIDEKMASGVTVIKLEIESYTAKARIQSV